jgi:hypothetical protein
LNIEVPGVDALPQHGRFFRDGERDFVEISFTGVKDTVIRKVSPDLMAQFSEAWASYCDGTPMKQRPGTPLTDLAGVDELRAQNYISRNVHNVEELAALHDGQCQNLGHGTLTLRKAARDLLELRKFQETERSRDRIVKESASIGAVPAEKYASETDLAEVKCGPQTFLKGLGIYETSPSAWPHPASADSEASPGAEPGWRLECGFVSVRHAAGPGDCLG